jgi:Tol biopolymer transport system component
MIRAFLVLVMLSFTYPLQVVESDSASNISWSPDGEWIAYIHEEIGDTLFVMDPDGSNVTGVSRCGWAEWMPDGKTIACVYGNDSGGSAIRFVNADGSNPRTVFSDAKGIFAPSWSPDGRYFVYEHYDTAEDDQIWIADIGEKTSTPLTSGPGRSSAPAWSPDGTQIAYRFQEPNAYVDQIRLVDPDGENDMLLTSKRLLGHPVWSPDSETIAFSSQTVLYMIDRNGIEVTGLYAIISSEHQYDWSPASDRIAYGYKNEVRTIAIDGRVTETFATFSEDIDVEWVDWSPGGKAIGVGTYRIAEPSIWEIYLVDNEGAEPVKISHETRDERGPKWSPDGSRMLFSSAREYNETVCLTNPYGRQKRCVASFVSIGSREAPAWSPDSRHLVIAASEEYDVYGWQDVYRIDVNGGEPVNLTPTDQTEQHPSFSPDGTRIVFQRDSEIWTMDADGSNQTQLTNEESRTQLPQWSPDGKRIAYCVEEILAEGSPGNPNDAIWIMDADGGRKTQLTGYSIDNDYHSTYDYDWSPDNSQIVYSGLSPCSFPLSGTPPPVCMRSILFEVEVEGGRVARLVDEADSYQPAWSPDGTRIAYVLRHSEETGVYVLDLRTNETHRIATEGSAPQWSADGTRIAVRGDGVWVLEADAGE